MDLYTLDRNFIKTNIIEAFNSLIWTERYYGDGDFELVVPLTMENIRILPAGVFVSLEDSEDIMIVETLTIEDDLLKIKGITLLAWMNNRYLRTSGKHEDQYWYVSNQIPGKILWTMIYNMCVWESNYIQGWYNSGFSYPKALYIPGLTLNSYDTSDPPINVSIPFGPLYDAMKDLAVSYQIGMKILLNYDTEYNNLYGQQFAVPYTLGFLSYKGTDRTSRQSAHPVVRFSPQLDSLTNVKELQSMSDYKTVVYVFCPSNPNGLTVDSIGKNLPAGVASRTALTSVIGGQPNYSGFDVRQLVANADDITTDQVGSSRTVLTDLLNSRAKDILSAHDFIRAVDGEIVPNDQFQYGVHYGLGDIVEIQGNTGTIQIGRITEYIRAQDSAGEKSYPTVTMIG